MFDISELSRLDAVALKIIDILLQAFYRPFEWPTLPSPSFNYPAVVMIENQNPKPDVGVLVQVHLVKKSMVISLKVIIRGEYQVKANFHQVYLIRATPGTSYLLNCAR